MIGTQEIVIIVIIALIVFGPQKMPEIGRQIGQMMREFRKMSGDVQSALNFDGDDHNHYDNGYGSAYKAEPPGPLVAAPSYGETYATFPPQASDDDHADGAGDYVHSPADEASAYPSGDDSLHGARVYSAPENADATSARLAESYSAGGDTAETTNHVSVTNKQ